MSAQSDFPFLRKLNRRRVRLSRCERQRLTRLGLFKCDLLALERVIPLLTGEPDEIKKARREIIVAILHYRRHGAKVLAGLNIVLTEVLAHPWKPRVGSDALVGKARCDVRGFGLDNNLAALFVRALLARRPEAAEWVFVKPSWADLLVAVQWPPITTGKEGHEPEPPATPAATVSPQ